MFGLRKQIASDEWKRDGGRFIPHPATWLNGKRWEDEVSEPAQQHSGLPAKKLNADNFEQRDYSGVDSENMANIAAQIAAMKRGELFG